CSPLELTLESRDWSGPDSGIAGFVANGYWHTDQRAVLGPRTVVVLYVLLSEDLVQHEPGVRAALPDPAVGNDVFVPVQARVAVNLFELVIGPESAIIVGRLAPRHVDRGGNVTAALGLLLRQVRWGKEATRIFVRAANIDQALGPDCGNY